MSAARRSRGGCCSPSSSLLVGATPAAAEFGPIRLRLERLRRSRPTGRRRRRSAPTAATSPSRPASAASKASSARSSQPAPSSRSPAAAPTARKSSSCAANAPSISADGRYVSFTTLARLDPDNDPAANSRDVYVADMAACSRRATSWPRRSTAAIPSAGDAPCGLTYSEPDRRLGSLRAGGAQRRRPQGRLRHQLRVGPDQRAGRQHRRGSDPGAPGRRPRPGDRRRRPWSAPSATASAAR